MDGSAVKRVGLGGWRVGSNGQAIHTDSLCPTCVEPVYLWQGAGGVLFCLFCGRRTDSGDGSDQSTVTREPVGVGNGAGTGAPARSGRVGLSSCHNGTREGVRSSPVDGFVRVAEDFRPQGRIVPASVEYWVGARVATVRRSRVKGIDRDPKPQSWVRGIVKEFSRKSRNRLMRTVNKVRTDARACHLVTLTYPDHFPEDPARWKQNLRAFQRRLARAWGEPGTIWRLEMVDRKSGENVGRLAPHFHLLIWGLKGGWPFKNWLSRAWYEVVASGDPRHLGAGTNCQLVKGNKQLASYLSKVVGRVAAAELAKRTQALGEGVGRWWGVWHRSNLPVGVRKVCELAEKDAIQLLRYFRRHARIKNLPFKSLTCFLDCDQWALALGWDP